MSDPGTRDMSRRQALQTGAAAFAGVAWASCGRARGREPVRQDSGRADSARSAPPADDDALDEVLRRIHDQEPQSKQGLSTHAPMVAEVLCALGQGDRAMAWFESYDAPVIEIPSARRRIDRDGWRAALGPLPGAATWEASLPRFGDWTQLFVEELAEASWRDVLQRWAERLAAGISSAATHGVIRTAHAVRALSRRETAERRAELARGLAYWAAAYEELPARAHEEARAASYRDALARVPLYQDDHPRAPAGNIVSGLRHTWKLSGFERTRDMVAVPDDLAAGLSQLTAAFARVYLEHGTRDHAIAFVHAVTAPCALRKIAPHIAPETARAAFPHAWHAAAAIYCIYARRGAKPAAAEPTLSRAELVGRAVENGADHAIKFTEALLAENDLGPDPVYLAAAEDAVARL